MLSVHGLIRLPNNIQLTSTPYNDGAYFSFRVFSQDIKQKHYYYRCSMFVPKDELNIWSEKLKPGNIFLIEFAQLDSFTPEDTKTTYNTIKLQRQHFKLMKVKPQGDEK